VPILLNQLCRVKCVPAEKLILFISRKLGTHSSPITLSKIATLSSFST
jgi:hypothetical protein